MSASDLSGLSWSPFCMNHQSLTSAVQAARMDRLEAVLSARIARWSWVSLKQETCSSFWYKSSWVCHVSPLGWPMGITPMYHVQTSFGDLELAGCPSGFHTPFVTCATLWDKYKRSLTPFHRIFTSCPLSLLTCIWLLSVTLLSFVSHCGRCTSHVSIKVCRLFFSAVHIYLHSFL